jgi:hypothetical protein
MGLAVPYMNAPGATMATVSSTVGLVGGAGKVREHLYGPGSTKMECATCHAVHNKQNTGEALLWRSDQNSRLCLYIVWSR